jgi:hypothetical protein
LFQTVSENIIFPVPLIHFSYGLEEAWICRYIRPLTSLGTSVCSPHVSSIFFPFTFDGLLTLENWSEESQEDPMSTPARKRGSEILFRLWNFFPYMISNIWDSCNKRTPWIFIFHLGFPFPPAPHLPPPPYHVAIPKPCGPYLRAAHPGGFARHASCLLPPPYRAHLHPSRCVTPTYVIGPSTARSYPGCELRAPPFPELKHVECYV